MTTKFRHVDYVFDMKKWGDFVGNIPAADVDAVCELIGVKRTALWHWCNLHRSKDFPFPSMSRFLAMCKLYDLNPATFFTTED